MGIGVEAVCNEFWAIKKLAFFNASFFVLDAYFSNFAVTSLDLSSSRALYLAILISR